MGLIKCRIGDCVELYNEVSGIPNLTVDDVSGVNREKEFFEPSKQVGNDTSKYKVVPPNYFACNLMHVGRDKVLPIAMNHTKLNKYVSPAYTVFCIKENTPLLKDYFFMMLKSEERDRYFWFHTDSSVRDGMTWDAFCDLEFSLPELELQQKYSDIYTAMCLNQQSYEAGLEDLQVVCHGYIDELRKTLVHHKLGNYISLCNRKNANLKFGVESVRGISIEKKFIQTKADMSGVSFKPYTIIEPDEFAYVTVTSRNGEKISLAHNNSDETFICSSSYVVFRVNDKNVLLPSYLAMLFGRGEFDRYARFHSWGSTRETFDWNEMCDVEIPIPDVSIQGDIVNIYEAYIERREINEKLKAQIQSICTILIKGSIEEARA